MRWRPLAGAALLWLAWGPAAAPAAAASKSILILRSGSFAIYDHAVRGFVKELGTLQIPYTLSEKVLPAESQVEAFMADIKASPPDLIFTVGTQAALAVQSQAAGIPFVYCMVVDPPTLGLGGGGVVMEAHPAKQIAFIRESFPHMKRIGVIHSTERNQGPVRLFRDISRQDPSVVLVQADSPEQMSKAIQKLSKEADCLLMVADATLYSPQTITQIILQTLQLGLPLIAVSPSFVKAGALAALYPDYEENGMLAAQAAGRFFRGESLKSMQILWPERCLSAVNLIVANRLNISVPEKAVQRASEVVR